MRIILFLLVAFGLASGCNMKKSEEYFANGQTKYSLKDFQGAIAEYGKAIELDPKNADAFYERAYTKYRLDDLEGAIADYSKVIEIKPSANVYKKRGYLYTFVGEKDKGCQDFKKAGEMGDTQAENYIKQYCN